MKRITPRVVAQIGELADDMTGGAFAYQGHANPGDGIRYLDGKSHKVWKGHQAARKAVAYYMGAIDWARAATGTTPPGWYDTLRAHLNPAASGGALRAEHSEGFQTAQGRIPAKTGAQIRAARSGGHLAVQYRKGGLNATTGRPEVDESGEWQTPHTAERWPELRGNLVRVLSDGGFGTYSNVVALADGMNPLALAEGQDNTITAENGTQVRTVVAGS